MATLTRAALRKRVSHGLGVKRSVVRAVIGRFLEEVMEVLVRGDRVELRDFGVFDVREFGPKRCRDMARGREMVMPAYRVVKFRAGRVLCRALSRRA